LVTLRADRSLGNGPWASVEPGRRSLLLQAGSGLASVGCYSWRNGCLMTIAHFNPAIHEDRPPAFSDEALTLQFAEQHQRDLRFVAAWGKWLSWAGNHWRLDDTLLAYDLVRKVCRDSAASCNNKKIAPILASAKTVAAVERLARSDRRIAQLSNGTWTLGSSTHPRPLSIFATARQEVISRRII
jgi:hypothetical protein